MSYKDDYLSTEVNIYGNALGCVRGGRFRPTEYTDLTLPYKVRIDNINSPFDQKESDDRIHSNTLTFVHCTSPFAVVLCTVSRGRFTMKSFKVSAGITLVWMFCWRTSNVKNKIINIEAELMEAYYFDLNSIVFRPLLRSIQFLSVSQITGNRVPKSLIPHPKNHPNRELLVLMKTPHRCNYIRKSSVTGAQPVGTVPM